MTYAAIIAFSIAGAILLLGIIGSILIWFKAGSYDRGGYIFVTVMASAFAIGVSLAAGFDSISDHNQSESYNERYGIHVTHLGENFVRYNNDRCYAVRVDNTDTLLALGCLNGKEVGE